MSSRPSRQQPRLAQQWPTVAAFLCLHVSRALGDVLAAGLNDCGIAAACDGGQLGVGDYDNRPSLTSTNFTGNPVAVAAGNHHAAILSNQGILFVTGDNTFGQLGVGSVSGRQSFARAPLQRVNRVACGGDFTLVLQEGRFVSFGRNHRGQLGVGDNEDRYQPADVIMPDHVVVMEIVAGKYHSGAVSSVGDVFMWGYNQLGQLGTGVRIGQSTPQQIRYGSPGGAAAVSLSAGQDHTLLLLEDGTVHGCGSQASGQIGVRTLHARNVMTEIQVPCPSGVREIAAGQTHSFFICRDITSVYACGENGFGQLGVGNSNDVFSPIIIPRLSSFGSIPVSKIVAGDEFSVALLEDGKVWAWGRNEVGQQARVSVKALYSLMTCEDSPQMPLCGTWAAAGLCPSMSVENRLLCARSCQLPDCAIELQQTYFEPQRVLDAGSSIAFVAVGSRSLFLIEGVCILESQNWDTIRTCSCQLCPAGFFAGAQDDLPQGSRCRDGAVLDVSLCFECLPGTFSFTGGAQSCSSCSRGRYQPNRASDRCFDCDAGSYQEEPMQDYCDLCPVNTFLSTRRGTVAAECALCATGKQSTAGSAQCEDCAAGYYGGQVTQLLPTCMKISDVLTAAN